MFMTAWVFEAHHYPTLPNEIKKTKLQIYTSPQAGINILLAVRAFHLISNFTKIWYVNVKGSNAKSVVDKTLSPPFVVETEWLVLK